MGVGLIPEWIQSKAIWLRWPYRKDIWPHQAAAAQREILALCKQLSELSPDHQVPVHLMVTEAHHSEAKARMLENDIDFVTVHIVEYSDIWIRDCAPFITGDETIHHFSFDGWNGIDDRWALDIAARDWLSQYCTEKYKLSPRIVEHPVVLEGGAIHCDGEGTALVCAGSILHREANQSFSVQKLEAYLSEHLGIDKVLWLPGHMSADETGGHVDNMANFLAPGLIAINTPMDSYHVDAMTCERVERYLTQHKDAKGRAFNIVKIPMPETPKLSYAESFSIEYHEGVKRRLPQMPLMANYLNFIRCNNVIVLPAFHCETDDSAAQLIRDALPAIKVIQAPARALLAGGGGWHCASWVEPDLCTLRVE